MHTHACTYINQDIHGVRAASSRRGRHVRQVTSSWCVTQQQREKPTPQRPQSLRAQSTNTSQTQQACKPLVSKSLLAVGCQQRMPQRQWYLQGQRHIVVQTMQQHAGGRKWVVANTGVGVRWHMSARNKKHGFGTLYLWHIAPRKGAPLRHETPRRSVACSKQLFCSEAQRLLSIKPQSTSLEQYDGHHTRNNEPRPCCQHHNCASMVIQPQPCSMPVATTSTRQQSNTRQLRAPVVKPAWKPACEAPSSEPEPPTYPTAASPKLSGQERRMTRTQSAGLLLCSIQATARLSNPSYTTGDPPTNHDRYTPKP